MGAVGTPGCPKDASSSFRSSSHDSSTGAATESPLHQLHLKKSSIMWEIKNSTRADSKLLGRQTFVLLGENLGNLIFQEALKCTSIHEPTRSMKRASNICF